jgi:hypothetical protein
MVIESESIYFLFTIGINDIQIPRKAEIKYLGMTIDSKLAWKQHIIKKRKQANIIIKQLNWRAYAICSKHGSYAICVKN